MLCAVCLLWLFAVFCSFLFLLFDARCVVRCVMLYVVVRGLLCVARCVDVFGVGRSLFNVVAWCCLLYVVCCKLFVI